MFATLLTLALVQAPAAPANGASAAPSVAEAYFAAGCFWCVETGFEGQPGVTQVISGFIGGVKPNPTYHEVSAGGTGYAEAVKVTFDPSVTSYAKLLETFWNNVDPVDNGGQFCDRGNQYRPGIFYIDDGQKALAETSKTAAAARMKVKGAIVVELTRAGTFYPAEDYHQDFWKKDPDRYYGYRRGCGRDARLEKVWGHAPQVAH